MILVTGANSLLGTNVVIELLARDYKVRALVRRSNKVLDNGIELIVGDVNSDADLHRAMEGCSGVIHIAAITAQDLLRVEDYRFNWECAQRVAEMATTLGVERFTFISSANTIGNGTAAKPADETEPLKWPYSGSLYTQSKVRAEAEVLKAFPRAMIINPGFMLGAYDSKPSSGEIIRRAQGHTRVFAPRGGKSFVHVRDVAVAVVNSLSMGRSGERYLATGVSMSFTEFYGLMQQVTAQPMKILIVPSWLLRVAGIFGAFLRTLGLKIPISGANMGILCQSEHYDNSKISRELQMPQTPILQAVQEAIDWFEQQG